MKIVAIDTSAKAASAAVCEDGKLVSEFYTNCGLTHSRTLLPMVKSLLEAAGISLDEIDGFAVSAGPGSFTGLRIGIATVKGLALSKNTPCAAVSTLESLAYNISIPGRICALMDARCSQVYTATFDFDGQAYTRLTPDEAITLQELSDRLGDISLTLVGDGAQLAYNFLHETHPNVTLAAENVRFQHASSVGFVAQNLFKNGQTVTPAALEPCYLRLPQAQRERLKKQQ